MLIKLTLAITKLIAKAEAGIKAMPLGYTASEVVKESGITASTSPAAYAFASSHVYLLLAAEAAWRYIFKQVTQQGKVELESFDEWVHNEGLDGHENDGPTDK